MNQLRSYKFFTLLSVLIFIGIIAITSKAYSQNVMRIAAVVNDDIISAHDLGQRIRLTMVLGRMQDTQELRKRLASSILRTMVDEKLMLQEMERLDIEITDEQLKGGINNFARIQRINPERFDALLESIDVDPLVVEDQARAQLGWSIAVRRIAGSRLAISKNEVDAALQKIQENRGKPEYRYSEIYLPIDNPSERNRAEQTAQRLIGFIQGGSPFAVLARDFSKSASASKGGNLDWVQSGNIAPEIEAILANLPIGSVSNPIRTPSGIYIVSLRDKRIFGDVSQDDVFKVSQLIFPLQPNSTRDIIDAKMAEARLIMNQVTSCENLNEIGNNIQNATSSIVDNIKLSSTPVELRKPLSVMQTGQITTITQADKAVLIMMVCDRQKQEEKPESLLRRELQNKLFNEKIALEQTRQLKVLRRNAIVDIRL